MNDHIAVKRIDRYDILIKDSNGLGSTHSREEAIDLAHKILRECEAVVEDEFSNPGEQVRSKLQADLNEMTLRNADLRNAIELLRTQRDEARERASQFLNQRDAKQRELDSLREAVLGTRNHTP